MHTVIAGSLNSAHLPESLQPCQCTHSCSSETLSAISSMHCSTFHIADVVRIPGCNCYNASNTRSKRPRSLSHLPSLLYLLPNIHPRTHAFAPEQPAEGVCVWVGPKALVILITFQRNLPESRKLTIISLFSIISCN